MSVKVLLYEDNIDLRKSLSVLINFSEGFELLGAFENCEHILTHIEQLNPDIVLMDIDMPKVNGIEGLKRVRSISQTLPVLMLTVFEDDEHILTAISEGATGYLLKQHITTRLIYSIKEAMEGGAPMSPIVAKLVLQHISNKKGKHQDYQLTQREKQVLQLLTYGNSYKMVAAEMEISISTVSTHIKSIYEKLGVHSQAEAVSKTLREKIV